MATKNKTKIIAFRVNPKLFSWLKNKAIEKNCNIGDLIRDAVLAYKEINLLPENMRFSNSLHVEGAKYSIMTFRLLERFIRTSKNIKDSDETINAALKFTKSEIDKLRTCSRSFN